MMKKFHLIFIAAVIFVSVLTITGIVSARPSGPNSNNSGTMPGYGMGNSLNQNNSTANPVYQNNRMGQTGIAQTGNGIFHDEMISLFAEKLGISEEDLNTRIENGSTMSQIADEQGLTTEEFQNTMSEIRTEVFGDSTNSGMNNRQENRINQPGSGRQGHYGNPDCQGCGSDL
ncbi:MAG: hypothetical protein AB9907_12830 [Flexilinea sp.]